MMKRTFFSLCLIAICIEFKETSACRSYEPPCKDEICEPIGITGSNVFDKIRLTEAMEVVEAVEVIEAA